MIPTKLYLEAFNKAREFMIRLSADNPRFRNTVIVNHQDGSHFVLTHAFIAFDEKEYFVVIPEHHDVHIFYKGDCHDWSEMREVQADEKPGFDPHAHLKGLTPQQLATEVENETYKAISHLYEFAENKRIITGNGHHMAQKVAGMAKEMFSSRIKD